MGMAYSFFYCGAEKEAIEAELPTITRLVGSPLELTLTLYTGFATLNEDALQAIVQQAEEVQLNYIIECTLIGTTNLETAGELAVIMNQMYTTPLYAEGEEFRGGIVYKDEANGIFQFRD